MQARLMRLPHLLPALTLGLMLLAVGVPALARAEQSGPFGIGNILSALTTPAATADEADPDRAAKKAAQAKLDVAMLDQLTPTDLFMSLEAAQRIQEAIALYQDIVSAGGWPSVKKGTTLHAGDQDEIVPLLRKRLRISGDYEGKAGNDWGYDERTQAALMRFQRRHGMMPTGVLDVRTVNTLNIPAEQRLAQLRANLVRMQDIVTRGLPDRYVMVNAAAMELQAIDEGRIALKSRVIVGRLERPTPFVAAKIQGLNFFPFWNVPESIAAKDLRQHMVKEPNYLYDQHIRALATPGDLEVPLESIDWNQPILENIRFRQDPGDFNALGLVRIDMPNPDNVYMHDTPMKDLFRRPVRAYSAGCVRVQKIFDLAAWVAGTNGGWDRARVDSTLQEGFAVDVKLDKPIPVYFIYQTAWVDTEIGISFRNDIYGRDNGELDANGREPGEAVPVQALAP
jgi:L,D-transpeptidase YcbB